MFLHVYIYTYVDIDKLLLTAHSQFLHTHIKSLRHPSNSIWFTVWLESNKWRACMSKIPLDGLNGLGWSAFTVVLQHYYASVAGCSCAIMSLQPFDILSLLTWGSYALKRWDQPAFFGRSKNPHHYFVATKSSDAQSIICHSRSFKVICSTISLCIRRHTRSIVLPNDFFSIWSRKNDEKGWNRMKKDEKGGYNQQNRPNLTNHPQSTFCQLPGLPSVPQLAPSWAERSEVWTPSGSSQVPTAWQAAH